MKNQLSILSRDRIKCDNNRHTYCGYLLIVFIGFISSLSLHLPSFAATQFEEVTTTAGIHHAGQSYGVSWGDFNGDGWPDAWVTNHLTLPSLYLNNGNGAFTDIAASVWPGQANDDTHGAAWGDFDNDGDQDIYQTIGAQEGVGSLPKQLLVNEGGVFIDKAALLGVVYPLGRMRTALWVDQNNDGKLDLVVSNELRPDHQAPSTLFRQTENGFIDVGQDVGFEVSDSSAYTQISDLNGDGQMDLLVHGGNFGSNVGFPYRVYDLRKEPFTDLQTSLGLVKTTHVLDSAIADFNGDLKPDIFLARLPDLRKAQSDVALLGANVIHVRLVTAANEHGVSFQASGNIKFKFAGQLSTSLIYIGTGGWHPSAIVSLSPTDSKNWGIANHIPGVNEAVYVGYEPATQIWTILSSSPLSKDRWVRVEAPSPSTVSQITAIHFDPAAIPLEDRIFFGSDSGFVDASATALPKDENGALKRTWCKSVIAGDFDNDMDVDLYMVCTRTTANLPNMLYENLGDGRFVTVPDAGGAVGSLLGRGESVAAADYDRDGFLDLYVTNGFYSGPFNLDAGPDQLFHNRGNGNHWLEIDLQGVLSNRDGIGAQIFATTPDGKIQLREQNGGIHRYAQNHQRIHFGLGGNTAIQRLVVHWPSGQVQELRDVPADQILRITEVQSPTVAIEDVTIDNRANKVVFTVSLSEPAKEIITVNYATADGTAAAGVCYTAVSGQLTFNPGEQIKTVEVDLLHCTSAADINFVMKLYDYQNVGIADGVGVATLTRLPIWFNDVTQTSGLARYGQGVEHPGVNLTGMIVLIYGHRITMNVPRFISTNAMVHS